VNYGLFSVYVPIEGEQRLLMSHIRVLCVQNHSEYVGTLKYMLETAGYEVMVSTNRGQALRLLTTLDVDGVLLEYDLPDATGIAVRAEMQRIKPDVPVLLLVALAVKRRSCFAFLMLISRLPRGSSPILDGQ
jgi:CheY-like chemotaxis protein